MFRNKSFLLLLNWRQKSANYDPSQMQMWFHPGYKQTLRITVTQVSEESILRHLNATVSSKVISAKTVWRKATPGSWSGQVQRSCCHSLSRWWKITPIHIVSQKTPKIYQWTTISEEFKRSNIISLSQKILASKTNLMSISKHLNRYPAKT
jgi:hypothetical protein